MCTVALRFQPGRRWPLLLAAVRDEFTGRPWDPPAAHWPEWSADIVGGRDRVAGGTWLAVRADRRSVAAVLNGVRRPPAEGPARPSRGRLPLAALTGPALLEAGSLVDYDGFHLVLGRPDRVTVWTWDGRSVSQTDLTPGDHVIVNDGVDAAEDPLVPTLAAALAGTGTPELSDPSSPPTAWGAWLDLLQVGQPPGPAGGHGDPVGADHPVGHEDGSLLVSRTVAGRHYGSTSVSLVGLAGDRVRYEFTATPFSPQWSSVPLGSAVQP